MNFLILEILHFFKSNETAISKKCEHQQIFKEMSLL